MSKEIWTPEQINKGLRTLPTKIAQQSQKVNQAWIEYRKAKANREKEEAVAMFKVEDDLTVAEKEAKIRTMVDDEVIVEIEAEGKLKGEETKLKQLEDTFIAIRKASSMMEKEFQNANV